MHKARENWFIQFIYSAMARGICCTSLFCGWYWIYIHWFYVRVRSNKSDGASITSERPGRVLVPPKNIHWQSLVRRFSVRIPFLFLDAATCYFSSSGALDRTLFTALGEVKVLGRTACRLLMLHRFKKIRLKHQAYPAGTPCFSVFLGSQNSLSSVDRPLKHVNTHDLPHPTFQHISYE